MTASAFPLFKLTTDGVVVEANAAGRALVATGESVVEAAEDGSRNRVAAALRRASSNPAEAGIRLGGMPYRLLLEPTPDGYHVDAVLVRERKLPPAAGDGLEAFVARTPVCLAHLDAAGIVTFESQLARTLLGYSSVGDAFLSSDPELDRAVDGLLAGGSSFGGLAFTTEVRGHDVPLVGYGSAVRAADGTVLGAVVAAVLPVSADGQMHLPRTEPDRGAFVSTVTHEVRNPLGVVNGFAAMLSEELAEYAEAVGTALPPPVVEFVETIQLNARRALDILADISDLAKLEAGALIVRREPVHLSELVRRVGRAFVADGTGGGAVQVEVPEAEALVLGDPQRIEQILNALLEKAVDGDADAVLRLDASGEQARVEVESDAWNAQLPQPAGGHVEDPVARYHRGGRGLAIARGLAEAMGGSLAYPTPESDGAFTLVLPMA